MLAGELKLVSKLRRNQCSATIWLEMKISKLIEVTESLKRKFRITDLLNTKIYPVIEKYLGVSRPIVVKADV